VRTLIIAEAGVNHNGDLGLALELVDAAAEAGADVVKVQTFSADQLATKSAATAQYQAVGQPGLTQRELLKRLELDREAHERLVAHCERRGIEFLSTAFDAPSLELLGQLGLRRVKVPSGEITNLPYLRQVAEFRLPVMLSSGMATLGEIETALSVLAEAGTPASAVTVLHCTSSYPTPMEEVNLRAMVTIREAFHVGVGYSDHTEGICVPIAAVALGASVIEKHLTIDRSLPGPDHAASLEPAALAEMVRAVRNIEAALGDGVKRVMPSEVETRTLVRKSLVAATSISRGTPFTAENMTTRRPGTGISPMNWDTLLGRRAPRAFDEDELLEL
jgi:N,N'-diacetyllegionaminate synthase